MLIERGKEEAEMLTKCEGQDHGSDPTPTGAKAMRATEENGEDPARSRQEMNQVQRKT